MNLRTNCIHCLLVEQYLEDVPGCNRLNLVSPIDGSPRYKRCSVDRQAGEGNCGPEGKFFVEKAK